MGHGRWLCCPLFQDIICDGDPAQPVSRSGALKTGGTYWYYYKVNDLVEQFNGMMPTTSNCPLLPGQKVNVLEVPRQCFEGDPEDCVALQPEMTLNPKNRNSTFSSQYWKRRRLSSCPHGEAAKLSLSGRSHPNRESLHRLQTAAAGLYVLRALDHSCDDRKDQVMVGRAQSAPTCDASRIAAMGHGEGAPALRDRKVGGHSPSLDSAGRPHPQTVAEHRSIDLLRTFSNPFSRHLRNTKQGRHILEGRRLDERSSSSTHRPSTCHGAATTSTQPRQPTRPSTAPPRLEVPSERAAAQTKRSSICTGFRNLRLRLACADLRAKQEDSVDSPMGGPSSDAFAKPLGRISEEADDPTATSTETTARMQLCPSRDDLDPFRASAALQTPETASPSPKSDFWGSPFRRSLHDRLSTPGTEYDGSNKSRASRLYSLANSRDGLGLNDESLSSQETLRPSRKPVHSQDDAVSTAGEPALGRQSQWLGNNEATSADTNETKNATNTDMIGDFSFLGSAIT